MTKLGSPARAVAILAGAAVAAFAVSTAAVSLATTRSAVPAVSVKYHFSSFSFTGGVSAPARPSTFSLTFTTNFALAASSPGIVNRSSGTLDKVTVEERVSYPVPSARSGAPLVGPAQLPFGSDKLAITVAISGSCFIKPVGSVAYVFRGSLKCATATLTLGSKTYRASALLKSITGSFTPPNPATGAGWTGSLAATFANPGYTFPVATLGSGGGTSLIIGNNGGSAATRSIDFAG